MKSDTPRTDAAIRIGKTALECSKLERELNEALALIQDYQNEIRTAMKERKRQQQILDALNKQ